MTGSDQPLLITPGLIFRSSFLGFPEFLSGGINRNLYRHEYSLFLSLRPCLH